MVSSASSNTPCRSKVFRFIRVICHDAVRAISRQSLVVNGSAVFPAAGYVELMLAAARETLPDQAWELEEIAFHDALILSDDAIQFVQTSVDSGRGIVEIKSRMRNEDGDWVLRASGRLRAWSGAEPKLKPWTALPSSSGLLGHWLVMRRLDRRGRCA